MSKSICAQESWIIDHPRPCDSVESQAVSDRGIGGCMFGTPANSAEPGNVESVDMIWTRISCRFMRRPADSDITSRLISGDFFPPEAGDGLLSRLWSLITWPAYHQPLKVGDLHRQNGKPVPVTEVWEDELTGARKSMRVVSSRAV